LGLGKGLRACGHQDRQDPLLSPGIGRRVATLAREASASWTRIESDPVFAGECNMNQAQSPDALTRTPHVIDKAKPELLRLAGAMRRGGASEDGIFAALKTENANRCIPPLPEGELRNIAANISRYPPGVTHDACALRVPAWPDPPESEAFYGLAGDSVRTVEPASEADPVALLVHFLVYFGNVIGPKPHFRVEADKHGTNLFAAMVGGTAKGRKGTARSRVEAVFAQAAPEWLRSRIQSGLSSGEGLIWAVHDRIERRDPVREKGSAVRYESVEADPGVDDKRLLVIEPEFASTLRVMERVGSILSATIRDAWDSGNLGTMTKNCPTKATSAHVSIAAHITRNELLRYLTTTEAGNGFANRFLWFLVRRSKALPEGGEVNEPALRAITERLRTAIDFAQGQDELRRDDEARAIWKEVYTELSEGKPGLLGAVISRAEAQVVRLSLLYALLDMSPLIRAQHMNAALALWEYAEASARFIFGDGLGDPVADELLKALRAAPYGLTRSEMSDLFGRNRSMREIDRALTSLAECGLADRVKVDTERGRPAERWIYAGTKETK
jgi:Protein of unknown function (DUF3987)/Primase C terminal 1 (PriCT-1)